MIIVSLAALLVIAFALACYAIPAWRPFLWVSYDDGSVRVWGSRRAYAIRRAEQVDACMRRHPAGSARR